MRKNDTEILEEIKIETEIAADLNDNNFLITGSKTPTCVKLLNTL